MGFLKRYKLTKQFFICFLIILIPIAIALIIVPYHFASKIISRKAEEQTTETVRQISQSYDSYLDVMINKLETIGYSPVVQEELTAPSDKVNQQEDYFYSRAKQIRRLMLQEYYSVSMYDIELTGLNGASYYFSGHDVSHNYDSDELQLMADESQGHWTLYNRNDDNDSLQMVKMIKELQTGQTLGYIRIGLRRDYLGKLVKNISFGNSGEIILLDQEKQILYGNTDIQETECISDIHGSSGTFNQIINNESYMVVYNKSADNNWTVVALIPYSFLNHDLSGLRISMLILTSIIILAGIMLSILMARMVTKPVEQTASALAQFSHGDFSVRLDEDRDDEIGQMNRIFNKAILDIQNLMQRVAQADILTREMEYKTLQSQMNPHFLYNTLDIINWMAFKKGDTEICDMVTAVSNLMRISINNKKSIITLQEEIGYVKDYLYIQHVRYQNRFEAFYDIDEHLYSQMIPKLIIEPIVENSIVHGIEDSEKTNRITIAAHLNDDENIEITVQDTGVGMSQEKADQLLNDAYNKKAGQEKGHTNLGIYAVNKRIKFLYGDEFGLSIKSSEGIGTTVIIIIPYMDGPNDLLRKYEAMLGGE